MTRTSGNTCASRCITL